MACVSSVSASTAYLLYDREVPGRCHVDTIRRVIFTHECCPCPLADWSLLFLQRSRPIAGTGRESVATDSRPVPAAGSGVAYVSGLRE
jgi:hypothetical protein